MCKLPSSLLLSRVMKKRASHFGHEMFIPYLFLCCLVFQACDLVRHGPSCIISTAIFCGWVFESRKVNLESESKSRCMFKSLSIIMSMDHTHLIHCSIVYTRKHELFTLAWE